MSCFKLKITNITKTKSVMNGKTTFAVCALLCCLTTSCQKEIISGSGKVLYKPKQSTPYQYSVPADQATDIVLPNNNNMSNSLESAVSNSFNNGQSSQNNFVQPNNANSNNNYLNNSSANNNDTQNNKYTLEIKITQDDKNATTTILDDDISDGKAEVVISKNKNATKNQNIKNGKKAYYLQVGYYKDIKPAKEALKKIQNAKISGKIETDEDSGFTRVLVGSFKTKNCSQSLIEQLDDLGFADHFWTYR